MRTAMVWAGVIATSMAVARLPALAGLHPFWPALAALTAIVATRQAVSGLAAGVVGGCLVISGGDPLEALRISFTDHLFPALSGPWHVGALLFTLLLGAFAGLLEASGGFTSLLNRLLRDSNAPAKRVLGSVYGLGLLCFFDGLANSMLVGRIARPAVDRTGISREKLAWVVDSTSSPVACVAFISTWIATQLSLIHDALPEADAYALYFRSIPANPYCLLTLMLVPLAISWNWEPRTMRRFKAIPSTDAVASDEPTGAWRVLVPLAVLAASIALSFQIWSGNEIRLFSLTAWRTAASSSGGPMALVAGALAGLTAAWLCFPRKRLHRAGDAALQGAAGLLPALIVLILAWSLGSVFTELGAAERIRHLLGDNVGLNWLPLAVFAVAAATSFATGSSWGTMGILMPLALGVLAHGSLPSAAVIDAAPAVIGAVFGGAVFGDHCSPFSDTTIVSAVASGCRPVDHVISQLPYALAAALAAAFAYALMAPGLPPFLATLAAGLILALLVRRLAFRLPSHP